MSSVSASLQSAIDGKGGKLFSILYANSPPRVGSYVALAKAIGDAGHLAAVVIPDAVQLDQDELTGFESVAFFRLPAAEMRRLKNVDIFFSSEVVSDAAPAQAATVCILHSIPDSGLRSNQLISNAARFIERNPTVIRTFDYLVVAVRQQSSHWTQSNYALIQGIYPAKFLAGRRPFLDIVPGGYPKLDYSRRILASSTARDCILYTPTADHSPVGNVRRDGALILKALLEAFPAMRVVFRPYPNPDDVQYGRSLVQRFSSNPNFVFDDSTTGIAHQRRSAVAVTDSSSSAITFSLATGRPLVFVDLEKGANSVDPQRMLFGFSTKSVDGMVEAVRSGIDDAARWKSTIAEQAESSIYNPGTAAAYLAAHLERFAKRQGHPDWLSVERKPWLPTGRDGEVAQHLKHLQAWKSRVPAGRASKACEEIERHLTRKPSEGSVPS